MSKRFGPLLAAVLFLSLGSGAIMFGAVPGQPPDGGDWVVLDKETVVDDTILLDGDLIVGQGGELELDNVTLTMVTSHDIKHRISVLDGGKLILKKCRVDSDNARTGSYYFSVHEGVLIMEDTVVIDTASDGETVDPDGLSVVQGDLTMMGSEVRSSSGSGIHIDGSEALIEDSSILANQGSGILVKGSSSLRLARSTIASNHMTGIHIENSTSVDILDSSMIENEGTGVEVDGGSATFAGNLIGNNQGQGVRIEDAISEVTFNKDAIADNNGWGIMAIRSEMSMEEMDFGDGEDANGLGDVIRSWRVVIEIDGIDGGPRAGAEVTITSADDVTFGPMVTDESGRAIFDDLVVSKVISNTLTWSGNPFKVVADLDVPGASITDEALVNVTSGTDVRFVMDRADLVLSNLHVSGDRVTKGEDLEVSVIVTNIGGSDPGEFAVFFYDGSQLVKKRTLKGLDSGTSQEVSFRFETVDLSTGSRDIKAVVDPANSVPEIDETNNELGTKVEVVERFTLAYAIPLLIALGIGGLVSFKVYTWALLRRLETKQKEKGRKEVGPKKAGRGKGKGRRKSDRSEKG